MRGRETYEDGSLLHAPPEPCHVIQLHLNALEHGADAGKRCGSRKVTANISQLLVKNTGTGAQKASRRGVTHPIWRSSRMLHGIDDARGHGSARRAQPLLRRPALQVAHVPSPTLHSAILPAQRRHGSKHEGTLLATSWAIPRGVIPKSTHCHTLRRTRCRHTCRRTRCRHTCRRRDAALKLL